MALVIAIMSLVVFSFVLIFIIRNGIDNAQSIQNIEASLQQLIELEKKRQRNEDRS
ncbi:MAG TPA: hypothetical protein VIG60_02850 [Savagea sp.]